MPTITRTQFLSDLSAGITNDEATQRRLTALGVDGAAMLGGADADHDGRIVGGELAALWTAIDARDNDGRSASISASLPVALVGALRAPTTAAAGTLARGSRGPEVSAAQELLIALGYDLGMAGGDGDYGGSTFRAVQQFQRDQRLPVTGALDAASLARLRSARPAYPEYDRMFADGVLRTTLGVGFDEDGSDLFTRPEILEGLAARGFSPLTVSGMSDADLRARGFDPATIDRSAVYYTRDFEANGRTVHALVRLVDRNTPNASDQFRLGMRNDDLILYCGHGRRGSGPDFDADSSPAGNFVVGEPYEAGHYTLGANDLDRPHALSDGYQLMLFNGCNTYLYADDFRSRVTNKSSDNLDLILTNDELYWTNCAAGPLTVLDGVMARSSMREITRALDAANGRSAGERPAFRGDGFRGNRFHP